MSRALGVQSRDRRSAMLRTAMGPAIGAALADPAPSVRAIAADHLEALFEERPAVPPPPATQSSVAIVPGQDVLVEAKTGSGKTLLFLLPILQCLA